ncbi:MAG: DUF4962 domain-containing protein, partial [bacterium]|nr:DUF4962 domain-containing protein [bacterium]
MAYRLDETPGQPGEWGFRPAEGSTTEETPPGFVWRPQEGAVHYDLQCTREAGFSRVDYEGTGLTYMVHRPSKVFEPGEWFWRFRAHRKDGQVSEWSQPRGFVIDAQARALALPEREELIGRIPKGHPRLFVRPENLEDLRKR